MIVAPHVLQIGAAGRNVGKTEFACAVIAKYAHSHNIIGVKITTVSERNGQCPRGGHGCGVCTSLKGNYSITEETLLHGSKDTVRMLRSGARKVYWLRVLLEHLKEGCKELFSIIPPDALVVCESNSARNVVIPGLFVVIQEKGSEAVKASCARVITEATKIVSFNGTSWDFLPENIIPSNGKWMLKYQATAIVLAGGESLRMGTDKSLLMIDNETLISLITSQLKHFSELLVSANDREKYRFLGLPVVQDEKQGLGPLMGILSCVKAATYEVCFVTSCDTPELSHAFIEYLLSFSRDYDVVLPRFPDGNLEPTFAVYRKSIIPVAKMLLSQNICKIRELFPLLRVKYVDVDRLDWHKNLNTRNEFENFVRERVD